MQGKRERLSIKIHFENDSLTFGTENDDGTIESDEFYHKIEKSYVRSYHTWSFEPDSVDDFIDLLVYRGENNLCFKLS